VRPQTIEYAPGDLAQIALPEFNPDARLHQRIAELSQQCHQGAAKGNMEAVQRLEDKLDETVIDLWDIGMGELQLVKAALAELEPNRAVDLPELAEEEL